MSDRFLLVGVITLTLVCYALHEWSVRLPPVTPATIENRFSGERTIELTRHILGDEEPHPVGSEENRQVKERILAWLDEHGINHEVQQTWGCALAWGRCAIAENIVATIPGQRDGPHIALMAHYDSVPPAPGAGDNAVAVATMMEVGRLLKADGELVNPLTLLLVDAEEQGLTGAEAFFEKHPLRNRIGALVNLEGSVNPGQTILFRTSGHNRGTLQLFGSGPNPLGSSHLNEIFNHMAVDTDFAVPKRHGVVGIDLAKVGARAYHHTKHDKSANLHAPSIQLMGDNIYHVARELVHADLDSLPEGRDAYGNIYGVWIQWSLGFNLVLVAVAFIALAITSWRIRPERRKMIGASLLPLGLFVLVVFGFAASYLTIHFTNGDTPFHPAHKWSYRLVLFATPILIGLLIATRVNRKRSVEEGLLGVWWFWWLISIAFALTLPDAAYIFVLPTVAASVLLAASTFARGHLARVLELLTLVIIVPIHLAMVLQIEQTQGYWFIAVTAIPFAIYVSAAIPLARGGLVRPAAMVAAVVWVVGFGFAVSLPLYTPEHPQTMIYRMVQDHDRQQAWVEFVSLNALPESIASVDDFGESAVRYPWTENVDDDLIETAPRNVTPPQLLILDNAIAEGGRDVKIQVSSQRNAMEFGVVFPPNAELTAFTIDGQRYPFEPRAYGSWSGSYVLELPGLFDKAATITFHFAGNASTNVWVYDITRGLPTGFEDLLQARTPLATEVHTGDHFTVVRQFEL